MNALPVVFLGARIKVVKLFVSFGHIYVVYYDHKSNECGLTVREFQVKMAGDDAKAIVEVGV